MENKEYKNLFEQQLAEIMQGLKDMENERIVHTINFDDGTFIETIAGENEKPGFRVIGYISYLKEEDDYGE